MQPLRVELGARWRRPWVRALLKYRALCLAHRAAATCGAGGARSALVWTVTSAPLWVLVAVCSLL